MNRRNPPWRFRWPIYEPDPGEYLRTDQGYVRYTWFERVAICMESGLSERDARNTACEDMRREISRELWGSGKP